MTGGKKHTGGDREKQIRQLATLPAVALEGLVDRPDTLVILPDGKEITCSREILSDAVLAVRLMEEGDNQARGGSWAKSERIYRKARTINPLEPVLALSLGNVLCVQGKVDEGMAMMKRAVELCPPSCREHERIMRSFTSARARFER